MNLPEPITRKEIYLKAIAENGGGGGGGGSVEFITYEKEITTSQYNWWYVEDKDGQLLNADEYELLGITFIRRPSDGETDESYLFCPFQIDTATSPVSYPTYLMTMVSTNSGSFGRTSLTKKVRVIYFKK